MGVDESWIAKRTGTSERPWAVEGERMSDFAAQAGRDALARAGVESRELDLVLVATSTADEITPNAAPLVAGLLGASRAGAFDVGSACTGWLAGVAMACGQIESGRARHALVVGADFLSRFLDYSDRGTAPLFADGAGAAVVSASSGGSGRIGPVLLRSDHEGADLIRLERGGPALVVPVCPRINATASNGGSSWPRSCARLQDSLAPSQSPAADWSRPSRKAPNPSPRSSARRYASAAAGMSPWTSSSTPA
jgi:3-oxoacyl-(acyl-carrier-protein) synthase III